MFKLLFLSLLCLSLQAEIVLEVSGFGNSKKEAKEEALRALSESVISKINSTIKKSERVDSNGYEKKQEIGLKISSEITFKGVTYVEVSAGKTVEMKAQLSDAALDETLDYMLAFLEGDHSQLSVVSLKEHTDVIEKLYALLNLTKGYHGKYNYNILKAKLQAYKKQNNHELNYGRLIIVSDGVITLDGKTIKANTLYFYPPSNYRYVVTKEGCVKEEGKIHLYKTKTVKKEINLVCNSSGLNQFSLDIDANYMHIAEDAVEKYGFVVNAKSANRIQIKLKEIKHFSVEDMEFFTYKVYLKILLPDRTIVKKATLKNVTKQTISGKMSKLLPLLMKAAFKEL